MGDIIQTVPLINRLHQEWPDVAIDLVVDQRLAGMTRLLIGIREVIARDFKDLRAMPVTATTLPCELSEWAKTVAAMGYDRVINLTFTASSGLLAAAIGAPDTRGVLSINGAPIVLNDWMAYCVDRHRFRGFNRFNVADLFALGGSGSGPWTPIRLSIPSDAEQWAARWLRRIGTDCIPVAVQIGASQVRKAWRPEYFARVMAMVSRECEIAFVLNSPQGERDAVRQAVSAYHQAGGEKHTCHTLDDVDVPRLAAVLKRCRLLLTNDTGPMHLAVGVGTPLINLSMGHVDFRETGPCGPGHWIIQPDIACGPCGLEQVCGEFPCKDRIVPEQVAALAAHALGLRPFPEHWSGVRVYESVVDADGLVEYCQRAGRDALADWYGPFWRRYWYREFTGQASSTTIDRTPPDLANQEELFRQMAPGVERIVTCAERLRDVCCEPSVTPAALKSAQDDLIRERAQVMPLAMASPLFGPITVALLRRLYDGRVLGVRARAEQQAQAYRTWKARLDGVKEWIQRTQKRSEVGCFME